MKLIPCNPAKGKAFSGMTDDELARHIEYEFPDLLGSLRLLLDRFQKRLSCIENCPYEEVALDKEQEFSCPSCGTKFKIEGMTNETNAGNGC